MLSWTSLRASYNTKYNWLASSLLERQPYLEVGLGNTLSNTQTKTINGELKFEELYNKSRLLRAVNTSMPPSASQQGGNKDNKDAGAQPLQGGADTKAKPDTIRNKKGKIIKIKKPKKKKKKKKKEKKDPNQLPQVGAIPKTFLRLLTAVKRVGIQYTEDMGTTLPGYMDSTNVMGYNVKSG